jgi:hypothetical protein
MQLGCSGSKHYNKDAAIRQRLVQEGSTPCLLCTRVTRHSLCMHGQRSHVRDTQNTHTCTHSMLPQAHGDWVRLKPDEAQLLPRHG